MRIISVASHWFRVLTESLVLKNWPFFETDSVFCFYAKLCVECSEILGTLVGSCAVVLYHHFGLLFHFYELCLLSGSGCRAAVLAKVKLILITESTTKPGSKLQ